MLLCLRRGQRGLPVAEPPAGIFLNKRSWGRRFDCWELAQIKWGVSDWCFVLGWLGFIKAVLYKERMYGGKYVTDVFGQLNMVGLIQFAMGWRCRILYIGCLNED